MCPYNLVENHEFEIMGIGCFRLDLLDYFENSNKILHIDRIYVEVVHPSIGYIEQQKRCPSDLVKNYDF